MDTSTDTNIITNDTNIITNDTNTITNDSHPINMNHQIRNNEWSEFEKSLGKGSELITNSLAIYVSNVIKGENSLEQVQISYPTIFPEGFDLFRKDKKNKIFQNIFDMDIKYVSKIDNVKKTDKMKLNNSLNKYNNEINNFIKYIENNKKKLFIPSPVNTELIDIKILELILLMNILIKASNPDMSKAYEAFFGIGKIIKNINTIKVKHHTDAQKIIEIPEIYIQPLKFKYNEFVKHFNFDFSIASSLYPKLFYTTEFDKIFPGMSIKPYESQKKTLDFVNNNISRPFVCVLNTLMGMGKTWVAGYVGLLVHLTNIKNYHNKEYTNKTFIYTCPETLKSVRHVVGRILHHHNIPFAVSFMEAGKVVIKKHDNCKNKNEKNEKKKFLKPTVILAGVQATIELLKNNYVDKKEKYIISKSDCIVFFDENTIQMDKQRSPMVPFLKEFYRNLPPQVIFSSATHPDINDLEELKDYAKSKYSDVIFETIDYSKVLIGTQLNFLNGKMFIPHSNSNDSNSMKKFIDNIKNNHMYKKFYTIPLIRAMYDKIIEIGLELPNELIFDNWLNDLEHRNQESIQDLGIKYLQFILEKSLTLKDNSLIVRFNDITKLNNSIDFEDLIKTSKILTGQTFISCSDPESLMQTKFENYFKLVMTKMNIKGFNDIYDQYKKQLIIQEKNLNSMAKSKFKNEDKISKLDREKNNSQTSSDMIIIDIPNEFKLVDNKFSIPISSINWDEILVSDFVKFAALFGILIYSENSHHTYNDFVIDIISKGNAIYVFADSTLNYGNSFPFNNGIITNDMASHSDKTLLQLMARAGRPGVSHSAIIYADDLVIEKIQDAIYNPDFIDIELYNLKNAVELANQNDIDEINYINRENILADERKRQALLKIERENIIIARLKAEKEARDLEEAINLRKARDLQEAKDLQEAIDLQEANSSYHNERKSSHNERQSYHNERKSSHNERQSYHNERSNNNELSQNEGKLSQKEKELLYIEKCKKDKERNNLNIDPRRNQRESSRYSSTNDTSPTSWRKK
jgi:hypothetical protein